jgi:hypothetical protein
MPLPPIKVIAKLSAQDSEEPDRYCKFRALKITQLNIKEKVCTGNVQKLKDISGPVDGLGP